VDYQALLYDPIYLALGVPATLTLDSGEVLDAIALDKTAGIDLGLGESNAQTVVPAAVVRARELGAKGVSPKELPNATLLMNGMSWDVRSYRLKPSPLGERDGEVYLILGGGTPTFHELVAPLRVGFGLQAAIMRARTLNVDHGMGFSLEAVLQQIREGKLEADYMFGFDAEATLSRLRALAAEQALGFDMEAALRLQAVTGLSASPLYGFDVQAALMRDRTLSADSALGFDVAAVLRHVIGRELEAVQALGFDVHAAVTRGRVLTADHAFGVSITADIVRRRSIAALLAYGFAASANLSHAAGVEPSVTTYDNGATGDYTTPPYNTLMIELWGAGGTGGYENQTGYIKGVAGQASTVSTFSLSAGGGGTGNPATQAGGLGGVASGGNAANTNGYQGGNGSNNGSQSGSGSGAPFGGNGGAAVGRGTTNPNSPSYGLPGGSPGGSGSGGVVYYSTPSSRYDCNPGGGSGAYVRHVINKDDPGAPGVGDPIAFFAAPANTRPSGAACGPGGSGRVRFTIS